MGATVAVGAPHGRDCRSATRLPKPYRIPMWEVADRMRQSGSHRIGDNVARDIDQIDFLANGAVIEPTLPNPLQRPS